jgi:hypothetical protein
LAPPRVYIADDEDIIESIDEDDVGQSVAIDDDVLMASLAIDDVVAIASLDIELSMLDDVQSIDDDIIELSVAELDDASWAKPGTTAAAKLPATSRAAAIASSFFISTSGVVVCAQSVGR